MTVPAVQRFTNPVVDHSYIISDKWEAKGAFTSASFTSTAQRIIAPGPEISDNDVLSRCLVGSFSEAKELPTLSDIRRWVSSKWSTIPGI